MDNEINEGRTKNPFLKKTSNDNPQKIEENFLSSRAQEFVGSKHKVTTGINLQESKENISFKF